MVIVHKHYAYVYWKHIIKQTDNYKLRKPFLRAHKRNLPQDGDILHINVSHRRTRSHSMKKINDRFDESFIKITYL